MKPAKDAETQRTKSVDDTPSPYLRAGYGHEPRTRRATDTSYGHGRLWTLPAKNTSGTYSGVDVLRRAEKSEMAMAAMKAPAAAIVTP
ncbi:MAG: hypothetical protein R2682_14010 [Pyrinomonadaceae bacterium]